MQELDAKLRQLPALELSSYLGELEAGGPLESLAPPVGSKPQKEDHSDVYEDMGHLCELGSIQEVPQQHPWYWS